MLVCGLTYLLFIIVFVLTLFSLMWTLVSTVLLLLVKNPHSSYHSQLPDSLHFGLTWISASRLPLLQASQASQFDYWTFKLTIPLEISDHSPHLFQCFWSATVSPRQAPAHSSHSNIILFAFTALAFLVS